MEGWIYDLLIGAPTGPEGTRAEMSVVGQEGVRVGMSCTHNPSASSASFNAKKKKKSLHSFFHIMHFP